MLFVRDLEITCGTEVWKYFVGAPLSAAGGGNRWEVVGLSFRLLITGWIDRGLMYRMS